MVNSLQQVMNPSLRNIHSLVESKKALETFDFIRHGPALKDKGYDEKSPRNKPYFNEHE